MKKGLLGIMLGVFALVGVGAIPALAAPSYVNTDTGGWGNMDQVEIGAKSRISESDNTGSALITTIKKFINWMLGMLATIALVICLYGGFLMVTAAGDETKHKKGLTVLKQAGIGLAIIGLSWLIVSVIFRLIGTMGGGGVQQTTTAMLIHTLTALV